MVRVFLELMVELRLTVAVLSVVGGSEFNVVDHADLLLMRSNAW